MGALPWQTIPDFLVLTAALYILLRWANQARALRIALAVVGLHALALVARELELVITSLVLDGAALLAVVMLLVVFQPELRRAFLRLDSALRFGPRSVAALEPADRAIATALFSMASVRLGALVVIVRDDIIGEMIDGGVEVNADVSPALLEAVFQKTSPLHDGAAVVERGRVSRVNAILPLTQRPDVPFYFGTRHRAAMGLAERCDAVVLAVSEERGEVTVMLGRDIRIMNSAPELIAWLQKLRRRDSLPWPERLRAYAFNNLRVKLTAAGLACLIWALSFAASGTTIRSLRVPIEFVNVPPGMDITEQGDDRIDVEVRGRTWLLDSSRLGSTVARFDLRSARPGPVVLPVTSAALNLPPGIELDAVAPRQLKFRLAPRAATAAAPR